MASIWRGAGGGSIRVETGGVMRLIVAVALFAVVLSTRPGSADGQERLSYSCFDFTQQRYAQADLDSDPNSGAALDSNGNGVACEDVFLPSESATQTPRPTPTPSAELFQAATDADRITALESIVAQQQRKIDALTARIDALDQQNGTNGDAQPAIADVHDLTGEIWLFADPDPWPGTGDDFECWGFQGGEGYSDIDAGLGITVRDESGKVIGAATLESGKTHESAGQRVCAFPFAATSLPDADFYTLSAGHRGDLTYSRDDLDARGWHVVLSLGN